MSTEERIDQLHQRIDGLYTVVQDGFTAVQTDMRALRKSVNHRVHELEQHLDTVQTDVVTLKRPWQLLDAALSGWKKAVALATAVGGLVAWATKTGFWPL